MTSDQSTDFDHASNFRYIPTGWSTGLSAWQVADKLGSDGLYYPSTYPGTYGQGASDAVTSTASYIPTTRASSSTGSASDSSGAPYSSNADNTYYGNMYIGHYYNWFASTAETGTYAASQYTARDSICPSGWQLPTNYYSTNKSMYRLVYDV